MYILKRKHVNNYLTSVFFFIDLADIMGGTSTSAGKN